MVIHSHADPALEAPPTLLWPVLHLTETKAVNADYELVGRPSVSCGRSPGDPGESAHGLVAWLYTDTVWYVQDPEGPHIDGESKTVGFGPEVTSDYSGYLAQAAEIVGVGDDLQAVARCEKKVQEELSDHVSAARSQPYYLDVTHPAANKGSVVDFLAVVYLMPKTSIATLGDMPNDVLMFKKSGMSIAMGNASKDVQLEANFVTGSNEEEGLPTRLNNLFSARAAIRPVCPLVKCFSQTGFRTAKLVKSSCSVEGFLNLSPFVRPQIGRLLRITFKDAD
jgi:hypothetical protein